MSGTYTLAEIHERHEKLERMAADIKTATVYPHWIKITMDEAVEFSPAFEEALNDAFPAYLSEVLANLDKRLSAQRLELKTDATAAYVAFMGGE